MNKFIGYFDFLGFKEFIQNNDLQTQRNVLESVFLFNANAISKGKLRDSKNGKTPDLSKSKIDCLSFSDTVVFWTKDDSIDSLKEFIEVTHRFNWQTIRYSFPVRGTILYGEIIDIDYSNFNSNCAKFIINSVYGKGIIDAYLKAESQNWSGTVIDKSVVTFLERNNISPQEYLNNYAKKYNVPYKKQKKSFFKSIIAKIKNRIFNIREEEEFAYCLFDGCKIDVLTFENAKRQIKSVFASHNKNIENTSVNLKLDNTIDFLKSHIQK